MDIIDFTNRFRLERDCIDYLVRSRDRVCRCGRKKFITRYKRKEVECKKCGKRYRFLVGTIFYRSSTPLLKWFWAIYLMSSLKTGISALQLSRTIKVTYKCAWRMAHKIRETMGHDNNSGDKLFGRVAIDETYVKPDATRNSRVKMKSKGIVKNQTPVVGAISYKDGKPDKIRTISLGKVDLRYQGKVHDFILSNIAPLTELHTDGWTGYDVLYKYGYDRKKVIHKREWVSPDGAQTQAVEGFWAHFKKHIRGTYNNVSSDYMDNYANEMGFRYNYRNDQENLFDSVLRNV